jgi:hypothetical protein
MPTIRLRELARLTPETRIDPTTGRVTNVKLLGAKSANNRTYTEGAMRSAVNRGLYTGKPIYLNHRQGAESRSPMDKVGWIERAWLAKDGIRGDINLLVKHPATPTILEMMQRNPRLAGFSHDAVGHGSADGRTITEIQEISSCDIVEEGATTPGGFFESAQQRGQRPMKTSRRKLRRRFREGDAMTPDSPMEMTDSGTTPGAAGDDEVSQALALLQQALDGTSSARHSPDYTKALQDAIDLLTPFAGGDDDTADDDQADDYGDGATESRRRRIAALRGGQVLLDEAARRARVGRLRSGR